MLSFFGFSYGYSKIVSIITEHLAISHRVKAMLLPDKYTKSGSEHPYIPCPNPLFYQFHFYGEAAGILYLLKKISG